VQIGLQGNIPDFPQALVTRSERESGTPIGFRFTGLETGLDAFGLSQFRLVCHPAHGGFGQQQGIGQSGLDRLAAGWRIRNHHQAFVRCSQLPKNPLFHRLPKNPLFHRAGQHGNEDVVARGRLAVGRNPLGIAGGHQQTGMNLQGRYREAHPFLALGGDEHARRDDVDLTGFKCVDQLAELHLPPFDVLDSQLCGDMANDFRSFAGDLTVGR